MTYRIRAVPFPRTATIEQTPPPSASRLRVLNISVPSRHPDPVVYLFALLSIPSYDTAMAEHSILKLDPDSHLLLERPLLRLPHELLKKTLKSAQRAIEPVNKQTTTAIQSSTSQTPAQTLASLDATLQKAQNLKRKLEALHAEEKALHAQQKARIEHL